MKDCMNVLDLIYPKKLSTRQQCDTSFQQLYLQINEHVEILSQERDVIIVKSQFITKFSWHILKLIPFILL